MTERISERTTGNPDAVALVGLPATVLETHRRLETLGAGAPRVIGAVLLGDKGEWGERLAEASIRVLGEVNELPELARRHGIRVAVVSLPLAMSGAIGRVRALLRAGGVSERFSMTMADTLSHEGAPARAWRSAPDFAALIGRPMRATNEAEARRVIGGRRVLITGAGGSIGSELALRCAGLSPSLLVVMDRSENALFEIERRLVQRFPKIALQRVLHDVVDEGGTLRLFREHRPEVVFHAAAHKHVPMMEDHPAAAVNNNLFGTRSVADAALASGTRRFVMVSTDKAVNPTSVMGATKRLAEIYVRSLNLIEPVEGEGRGRGERRRGGDGEASGAGGAPRFSLVRFGNVLGSACSVLPIWSAQLAEGAPITVTHPEMTRYFMSIPEAAALVIQAATIDKTTGRGDEVFVLDMGAPVRICELAERFVRSQGLAPRWEDAQGRAMPRPFPDPPTPGVEPDSVMGLTQIPIRFVGARPGEKLHEELAYQTEDLARTRVPGILAWSGALPDLDLVRSMIEDMARVRHSSEAAQVLEAIRRHVPEMRQPIVVCSAQASFAA